MVRTLTLVALLAAPLPGLADGAATAYFWKGGVDTAGLGLKGWAGLGQNLFLGGRLQSGSLNDLDYTEIRVGLGVGTDLGKGTAVFAAASAVSAELEDQDESGLALAAGVEFTPVDRLTLNAEFGLVDVGDFGEASEFEFGMAYAWTSQFALTMERSEQIAGTFTKVGLRFAF